MKAYVMDAFSEQLIGGNQAGVALPECPLSDAVMQQIAAEFKHSETAFVTFNDDGSVTLEVQGDPDKFPELFAMIQRSDYVRITDIRQKNLPPDPWERGFSVRGY